VLAALLIGLFVKFGLSFLVRSRLHIPVLASLIANMFVAIFAFDLLLALHGAHERMLGFSAVADGVTLYVAIAFLIRTRRERIRHSPRSIWSSRANLVRPWPSNYALRFWLR
jgi:hypothetical protein